MSVRIMRKRVWREGGRRGFETHLIVVCHSEVDHEQFNQISGGTFTVLSALMVVKNFPSASKLFRFLNQRRGYFLGLV